MPSIEIKEQDLTSGGGRVTNYNVVYIPGFMSTDTTKDTGAWPYKTENGTSKLDTSKAAKMNVPTLCSSVSEFETYFGTKPAKITVDGTGDVVDKSYIYAKELLTLGLPVLYESVNDVMPTTTTVAEGETEPSSPTTTELNVSAIKNLIVSDNWKKRLSDKGEYQFKYLTSGGYASLYATKSSGAYSASTDCFYSNMVAVAGARGDCMVLIDHMNEPSADLPALYTHICGVAKDLDYSDCCAVFTPWVNVDCSTYKPATKEEDNTFDMPPSFAYLTALAKSIRTNASWLAVAGATRGQIPNLNSEKPLNIDGVLSNSMAESFQNRNAISINAITNIKPFGNRIWGNRTLKDNALEGNLTATSFLNIRNMICDVKKVVYEACRKFTFEQNNDVLWLNFKSYIEPTLAKMKTGAGLSGYKIVKKTDTTEKAKLEAQIKLYPLYAVEDFVVEVQMLDNEIAVS